MRHLDLRGQCAFQTINGSVLRIPMEATQTRTITMLAVYKAHNTNLQLDADALDSRWLHVSPRRTYASLAADPSPVRLFIEYIFF